MSATDIHEQLTKYLADAHSIEEQALAQLRLADLGWDNSVSTTTWFGGIAAYYDEIAAAR